MKDGSQNERRKEQRWHWQKTVGSWAMEQTEPWRHHDFAEDGRKPAKHAKGRERGNAERGHRHSSRARAAAELHGCWLGTQQSQNHHSITPKLQFPSQRSTLHASRITHYALRITYRASASCRSAAVPNAPRSTLDFSRFAFRVSRFSGSPPPTLVSASATIFLWSKTGFRL